MVQKKTKKERKIDYEKIDRVIKGTNRNLLKIYKRLIPLYMK